MTKRQTYVLFCLLGLIASIQGVGITTAAGQTGTDRITIRMEACEASREGIVKNLLSALFGPPKEPLVKRGVLEVEGRKFTLYLPKAKTYVVRNAAKKESVFENTSTRLAIDQKGDGKLTEADNWFANMPVRLGDRMYDIIEIAPDGSSLVLQPSKSALAGVIVGRSCPPFSFKTADGKTISRDGLAGKAFMLDIWSIT
jgi:hypothetical protein